MTRNFRDEYQHEYGISQQSDEPRPHPGVIVGGEAAREKRREYAIVFGSKIFGSIAAIWWMLTYDTGWVEWSAFISGYIILMLGIVLGFHRYYSHKAFDTSVPMQYILGGMAQMSIQSSVLRWAADHRRHHAHSDEIGDIHSPWLDGRGRKTSRLKGMFHSHFGWFMDDCVTDMSIYGKGLADNDVVLWLHKTRWYWLVFSLIILPGVWGLVFGGWDHVISTILIGGYFRTFVVLQITLGISSYAPYQGRRHCKEQFSLLAADLRRRLAQQPSQTSARQFSGHDMVGNRHRRLCPAAVGKTGSGLECHPPAQIYQKRQRRMGFGKPQDRTETCRSRSLKQLHLGNRGKALSVQRCRPVSS